MDSDGISVASLSQHKSLHFLIPNCPDNDAAAESPNLAGSKCARIDEGCTCAIR